MRWFKLYPLAVPFLVWLLSEIYVFWPSLLYVGVTLGDLVIFYAFWQMGKKSSPQKSWLSAMILPLIFNSSLASFIILIPGWYYVQVVLILEAVFLYLYLRLTYEHWFRGRGDAEPGLKQVSLYAGFLAVFFLGSGLYGLFSFLNIAIWALMLAGLFALGLLVYFIFWAWQIEKRLLAVLVPLVGLLLMELAWAIVFLPIKFYIAGFILAVNFYLLVMFIIDYHAGDLNKSLIWRYLSFSFGCIILVMLTARWL